MSLFAEARENWHITCSIEGSEGNKSYPRALKGVAMKKGKIGGRRLLTIIMIGIIAGILAAIAVPLYLHYTETSKVREALDIWGIIKAVITSQKVERSRTGKYYSASTVLEFKARGIDISKAKSFIFETVATPNGGFTVTATPTDTFAPAGGWVKYIYDPSANPPGRWESEGSTILPDMLLLRT